MVYMGSKNKYAQYIIPSINDLIKKNKSEVFIDGCCGGANIIANTKEDILCDIKFGFDKNKYLIALLNKFKNEDIGFIEVDEIEYKKVKQNKDNYEDWYVGYCGFLFAFGGDFFNTYARGKDNKGIPRNMGKERHNNILKQKLETRNIKFLTQDIRNIDITKLNKNYLLYIDPPYYNTKQYKYEIGEYDKFWNLVRELSKVCIVVISEYQSPEDFESIWESEPIKISLNNSQEKKYNAEKKVNVERLWVIKNHWWKD